MKKITAILLCLAMLLSALALTGCGEDEEKKPAAETVDLNDGSTPLYAIIRGADASSAARSAISSFRLNIREKTTAMLELKTDADEKLAGLHEIIIGETNREKSTGAASTLGEDQFRIVMMEDDLVIAASNDNCLALALDTFEKEYVKDGKVSVPSDLDRSWQCGAEYTYKEIKNPMNDGANDPFVTYHDGYYYYCWSSGTGVNVSKAKTLDKVSYNGGVNVYTAPGGTNYSGEYWAPELHYIDGSWYIYVAADDGNDVNHRMWVLKGTDEDATRPFKMVGKIYDSTDKWAIDGTVLHLNDQLYFVWSGWAGDNDGGNQKLYIAHMSDPCTIDTKRVMISSPSYSWEGPLNEGPFAATYNGNTYIFFSGNGSWTDDYCVGYLKLTGNDPLKAKSWTKCSTPILSKTTGAYGPGHCSITVAADGTPWIVYHANKEAGTGWKGRSFWLQELKFNDKGDPKRITPAKTVKIPAAKWVVQNEITN